MTTASVMGRTINASTHDQVYASRFKQGGRTVYSFDLSPDEIIANLPKPDPEVTAEGNRSITRNHAVDFGKYVRRHEGWVSPGLLLRAPSIFHFEPLTEDITTFGVLSYARNDRERIRIVDGQHRVLGFHYMAEDIAAELEKAYSRKAEAKRMFGENSTDVAFAQASIDDLLKQRKRLSDERVAVQIVITESVADGMQIFADIADNAQGMPRSVGMRFDRHKVMNRAADLVRHHPLLEGRVDIQRDRVSKFSDAIVSLAQVGEITKVTSIGFDGRVSRRMEAELVDTTVARRATQFLDLIVAGFPILKELLNEQVSGAELRETSLLGSASFLRVLAGVYYELMEMHAFSQDMIIEFFRKLAPHSAVPVGEGSIWVRQVPGGVFTPGVRAPQGRRQELAGLVRTLIEWAIIRPAFLDEEPAPTYSNPIERV